MADAVAWAAVTDAAGVVAQRVKRCQPRHPNRFLRLGSAERTRSIEPADRRLALLAALFVGSTAGYFKVSCR